MTTDKALRRKPQQERSLRRFNHILDTAEALFARRGYENVTTNHIAAEADVSVGALYRFFPNKEAIIESLVERYIEGMQAALPQEIDTAQPMPDTVRNMILLVAQFEQRHASFKQVLTASQVGQMAQAATAMHLTIERWVERLLAAYHPQLSDEMRHLCAAAGMGIVKGMLTMTEPPDSLPFDAVLTEIVAALMAYVDDFVARAA